MQENKTLKTEEEWKKKLTPEQYAVLREGATEAAFTGKHLDNHENGTFVCMGCGAELFDTDTKFESGSGWPSFDKALIGAVILKEDNTHGMKRVEATCGACGSHLGHVFPDGPTETGQRFCINSCALDHKKK